MRGQRVVVTGLGVVSALGFDPQTVWQAVLQGKSGVCVFDHPQIEHMRARIAALVHDFQPNEEDLTSKEQRQLDLFIQYGVTAAMEAWRDAKLHTDACDPKRLGVAVGSGIGGLTTLEANHAIGLEKGAHRIIPSFIPNTIINMLPGLISIKTGARGPNFSVVSACATGSHNIAFAKQMISIGQVDVMIAGGAEKASTLLGMGGFSAMRALSTRNDAPQKASRPWDKARDGFVLGDGAAILILESYEHAKKRGAPIYAELSGVGMSSDAYHITLPKMEGSIDAMASACLDAGIQPKSIDYINAHATATPAGDLVEIASIKQLLGDQAGACAISATKSMTGHLLGAAGSLEAIFSIFALRDQIVPPTINLDTPDLACQGLNLVPYKAQKRSLSCVLSNSFGFGGTNVSLVFQPAS